MGDSLRSSLREGFLAGCWRPAFVGREGKHRAAPGIAIPPDLPERDLQRFLADLFHESARPDRPDVIRLPPEAGLDSPGPPRTRTC